MCLLSVSWMAQQPFGALLLTKLLKETIAISANIQSLNQPGKLGWSIKTVIWRYISCIFVNVVTIGLISNISLSQVLFQNTMVQLRDSGILNKLYEDALNAPVIMPDPKVRINQPLNISQLGTAFMVVAGGLVIGMLAFLGECFFLTSKIKRKQLEEVCWQSLRLCIIYLHGHFSAHCCYERNCSEEQKLFVINWMRVHIDLCDKI